MGKVYGKLTVVQCNGLIELVAAVRHFNTFTLIRFRGGRPTSAEQPFRDDRFQPRLCENARATVPTGQLARFWLPVVRRGPIKRLRVASGRLEGRRRPL